MDQLETLQRLATTLSVPLDDDAHERFWRFRDMLLDWNTRVNLTRITDPEEVEIKLFADALALGPWVERFRERARHDHPLRLVDIGSGAGFPGLPLKIAYPEIEMTLIEATGKKARFIEAAIADLELASTRVIHGRAEDLARDNAIRGSFDLVTARAVARLPALIEICQPFCRPGGWGIFPKGRDARAEAEDASRALKALNAQLVTVEDVSIPELAGTTVVIVEQRGRAPVQYPRRSGLPARNPL